MQYTKNYHMPQWVKSDRIMMDDFNRMCADIENGLTGNRTEFRQKDSELSGRIEQVAGDAKAQLQAADPASQTSLKTGLLRLAYNHCHLLAAVDRQPPQSGYFFQMLKGSAAPSAISGFLERGDALWLARGSTAYTSDDFRACLQQVSQMYVEKGNPAANAPLVLRFTPPGPGRIREFPLTTSFDEISKPATLLHFRFYNESTGEYEAEEDYTLNFRSGSSGRLAFDTLDVNLCFSGGVTYRIELSTKDNHYTGTGDYTTHTVPGFGNFTAESLTADTAGALSRTVQCGETRTDGIVLVHYRTAGVGGSLSLNWDGASFTPSQTRNIVAVDGKTMVEAEFRRNAVIPATTSLQLNARCGVGGEIAVYSWGLATI